MGTVIHFAVLLRAFLLLRPSSGQSVLVRAVRNNGSIGSTGNAHILRLQFKTLRGLADEAIEPHIERDAGLQRVDIVLRNAC